MPNTAIHHRPNRNRFTAAGAQVVLGHLHQVGREVRDECAVDGSLIGGHDVQFV
jgi:hypothetical protein